MPTGEVTKEKKLKKKPTKKGIHFLLFSCNSAVVLFQSTYLYIFLTNKNRTTFHMQLLLQLQGKGRIKIQTTHGRHD